MISTNYKGQSKQQAFLIKPINFKLVSMEPILAMAFYFNWKVKGTDQVDQVSLFHGYLI